MWVLCKNIKIDYINLYNVVFYYNFMSDTLEGAVYEVSDLDPNWTSLVATERLHGDCLQVRFSYTSKPEPNYGVEIIEIKGGNWVNHNYLMSEGGIVKTGIAKSVTSGSTNIQENPYDVSYLLKMRPKLEKMLSGINVAPELTFDHPLFGDLSFGETI